MLVTVASCSACLSGSGRRGFNAFLPLADLLDSAGLDRTAGPLATQCLANSLELGNVYWTRSVVIVECCNEPAVPVIVTPKLPEGVPGLREPPPPPPPPPQLSRAVESANSRIKITDVTSLGRPVRGASNLR